MNRLSDLFFNHTAILENFLSCNRLYVMVLLTRDGLVKEMNSGLRNLLELPLSAENIQIQDYCTSDSKSIIPLTEVDSDIDVMLAFRVPNKGTISIQCRLIPLEDEQIFLLGLLDDEDDSDILSKMTVLTNELANMTRDLRRKNQALKEAHSQIKVLSGILPICMFCKEIRDDKGYWRMLEQFITENSEAQFSHSICPDCTKKNYPDL